MSLDNLDTILEEDPDEPQPKTFPSGAVAAVLIIAVVIWGGTGLIGLFAAPLVGSFNSVGTFASDTSLSGAEIAIEHYMIVMEYEDIERAADMHYQPAEVDRAALREAATRPAYQQRVAVVSITAVDGVSVTSPEFDTLDENNPLYGSGAKRFTGDLTYTDGTQRAFTITLRELARTTDLSRSFPILWRIVEVEIND